MATYDAGLQALALAGLIKGKRVSAHKSARFDAIASGAIVNSNKLTVDGNLITMNSYQCLF